MPSGWQGIAGLNGAYPNLRIPVYQRSKAWKGKSRAALVKSLINDWPIGIIVLNKLEVVKGGPVMRSSHDIIDGQQRLSTIFEFMDNPLIHVVHWAPNPESDDNEVIQELRDQFDSLVAKLRKKEEKYVEAGMKIPQLKEKIYEQAGRELRRRRLEEELTDKRFKELVDAMERFILELSQRSIAVQELTGHTTTDAEKMYTAINTQGTAVQWWELLKAGEFREATYDSDTYSSRYTELISKLAATYRSGGTIEAETTPETASPSIWDALYALGEFYHAKLAGKDPKGLTRPVPRDERKLKVDGLGFRLVGGFLAHEISRVAVEDLLRDYSKDEVLKAIDTLFDAGHSLFDDPGKFKLFSKYAAFGSEVFAAYPVMCLILATSHFVAARSPPRLLDPDRESLRVLTEELLRESICSSAWSGSGDSRLKEWLNRYFNRTKRLSEGPEITEAKPFPGGLKQIVSSYSSKAWHDYLASVSIVGKRTVPKEWMYFHFVVQYLVDSVRKDSLPAGAVAFDHIVAYNSQNASTSSPFNFCAIEEEMNTHKGRRSYDEWSQDPSFSESDRARYRLRCLEGTAATDDAGQPKKIDFLAKANIVEVGEMVKLRKELVRWVFGTLVKKWIAQGD